MEVLLRLISKTALVRSIVAFELSLELLEHRG